MNPYDWYTKSLHKLREELDQAEASQALGIPSEPGGWWHRYVCPEHHSELLFDPLSEFSGVYRCPYGCSVSGETYDGAWLVFKHQAIARYALMAAAVYDGTGEDRYGELAKSIIVNYAAQYPRYPIHEGAEPWMLKGRAFHQALTEAIWATTLLRAYALLKDSGISFEGETQLALSRFVGMLEGSMEQYHGILTEERANPENNYTAWLNAALSCIYSINGDDDKLLNLVERRGGLRHHLQIAILRDGLEFEGSVYYHVFVLRAYMIAAEMLERRGFDIGAFSGEDAQSMEGMLDVLVQLADKNGRLPATHDGPYMRAPYAREISEVFEIGYTRFRKPDYLKLLHHAYGEQLDVAGRVGSLEAVLYGSGDWQGETLQREGGGTSALLPDSGIALLRNDFNPLSCMVDFGPHGGSHGHYDKLHLSLFYKGEPLSPDRGTVPYGSILKKDWYPHTACHNTVALNGSSQKAASGRCLSYFVSESFASISMETNDAYDGAVLTRHIYIDKKWVVDWFEIKLAEAGQSDWWLHLCGSLLTDDSIWEEADRDHALGNRDGYAFVQAVRCMKGTAFDEKGEGKQATVGVRFKNGEEGGGARLNLTMLMPSHTAVSHVTSPGLAHEPSNRMDGLLLRSKGTNIHIAVLYAEGDKKVGMSWASGLTDEGSKILVVQDDEGTSKYALSKSGLKELTV